MFDVFALAKNLKKLKIKEEEEEEKKKKQKRKEKSCHAKFERKSMQRCKKEYITLTAKDNE